MILRILFKAMKLELTITILGFIIAILWGIVLFLLLEIEHIITNKSLKKSLDRTSVIFNEKNKTAPILYEDGYIIPDPYLGKHYHSSNKKLLSP